MFLQASQITTVSIGRLGSNAVCTTPAPAGGPTWATLTSGSIGSGVAVLAAVGVAALGIWWDRRRDARVAAAEERRDDRRDRQRLLRVAQQVMPALAREVHWAPLLTGRSAMALLALAIEAQGTVADRHPDVAAWVLKQVNDLKAPRAWTYFGLFFPGKQRQVLNFYSNRLGEIVGALSAWGAGQIEDEWFTERLGGSTPDEPSKQKGRAVVAI